MGPGVSQAAAYYAKPVALRQEFDVLTLAGQVDSIDLNNPQMNGSPSYICTLCSSVPSPEGLRVPFPQPGTSMA